MMRVSGITQAEWTMYLMNGNFQLDCEKLITKEMLPKNCIIGTCDFAVALDEKNCCVEIAQTEVRFTGIAHRFKDVNKMVLMTGVNMAAAIYGKDMMKNMFRHNDSGADLVFRSGADRSIWGL